LHYKTSDRSKTAIGDFDGDLMIQIDRSELIGSSIYWFGYYARDELVALSKYLVPGAVFVDIGANLGEFSLFAGKRVAPGRVYAIEPLSTAFEQLEANVRLNGFANVVRPLRVALAESRGEVKLFCADQVADWRVWGCVNAGTASMFKAADRTIEGEAVRCATLDEVLATENVTRVNIIKIDTEGGELPVLRGAIRTIERDRPILLVEVCQWNFRSAGYSSEELMAFLRARDYHCSFVGLRGVLRTATEPWPEFGNLVCVPT
jgi:FkbM family methyltransferase